MGEETCRMCEQAPDTTMHGRCLECHYSMLANMRSFIGLVTLTLFVFSMVLTIDSGVDSMMEDPLGALFMIAVLVGSPLISVLAWKGWLEARKKHSAISKSD